MTGDPVMSGSREALEASVRMLRRDLDRCRQEREGLAVKLAKAQVRADALLAPATGEPADAAVLRAEVASLQRSLDLSWQERTSLEVRLAEARVQLETRPATASAPAAGGAAAARALLVRAARHAGIAADRARRRLRREASGPAAAPPIASAASPEVRAAPPGPPSPGATTQLDLARLRCVSVGALAEQGQPGWSVESVRIGETELPLVRVPDVRYLPDRGLTIVGEDMVPIEAVSYASNLAFMTTGERGGTVDAGSVSRIEGEVCILSNLFSMTFGHWLDEELPKVFLLERSGFRGRYVVVQRAAGQTLPRFVHESLPLLGVTPDRVIETLPGVTSFETAVFSPVIVQEYALRYRDVYLGFRDALLEAAGVPDVPPTRRLWMARGAGTENGRRELVNGDRIMDLLVRHGFEVVDMGARSFADQLAVARSASVLAGPHGSGMKHTLFQAPGSTLIECFTPHHLNTSVINLCRLLRHQYHMVVQDTAYTDYRWGLELHVPEDHLALILETLPPT